MKDQKRKLPQELIVFFSHLNSEVNEKLEWNGLCWTSYINKDAKETRGSSKLFLSSKQRKSTYTVQINLVPITTNANVFIQI